MGLASSAATADATNWVNGRKQEKQGNCCFHGRSEETSDKSGLEKPVVAKSTAKAGKVYQKTAMPAIAAAAQIACPICTVNNHCRDCLETAFSPNMQYPCRCKHLRSAARKPAACLLAKMRLQCVKQFVPASALCEISSVAKAARSTFSVLGNLLTPISGFSGWWGRGAACYNSGRVDRRGGIYEGNGWQKSTAQLY